MTRGSRMLCHFFLTKQRVSLDRFTDAFTGSFHDRLSCPMSACVFSTLRNLVSNWRHICNMTPSKFCSLRAPCLAWSSAWLCLRRISSQKLIRSGRLQSLTVSEKAERWNPWLELCRETYFFDLSDAFDSTLQTCVLTSTQSRWAICCFRLLQMWATVSNQSTHN